MQLLVTATQMQELDRRAGEEQGIPSLTLMENAGRAVVEQMEKRLGDLRGTRPLVVCGKGNNGGDGLVVTRLLLARGALPDCVLLGSPAELSGDALANYQRLSDAGFPVRSVGSGLEIAPLFQNREFVVDAIFGTGLTRAPTGPAAEAIEHMNHSGAYVVSVDLPSGLGSDTGVPYEPTVRADLTVTMALPKLGLWLYPGRSYAGAVEVADIGIPRPPPLAPRPSPLALLLDPQHVCSLLPLRPPDGHKGTFGAALIIAGSRGFSGAAILAGRAAVRSGCGLVRLAVPAGILDVVAAGVVEAVKCPLAQTQDSALSPAALETLLELAAEAEAVAIGPGIGTDHRTRELELDFLVEVERPTLVDADGLNNLRERLDLLARARAPLLLTPHPGELARLTGINPAEINANRVEVCRRFAARHKVVLLLKGASTVVAAPDGRVFVNPTGNSGLAKGGTGDVLTGLIVGLMAQGLCPLEAACAGAFIHGLAADIAAAQLTQYGLAAGDLPEYLPRAFASLSTLEPSTP